MREFKVSSHVPVVVDLRLVTLHGRFVRFEPLRREHAGEGVWRHHRLMPDGHRRDSVVYSILEEE